MSELVTTLGEVKVRCKGAKRVGLDEINELQGELKALSDNSYSKFKNQLIELGFSEPVSVWQNKGKLYILNGTQRTRTLKRMRDEGYKIPTKIPVNMVDASSLKEAKKKVLALTSQYGKMSQESLVEFLNSAGLNLDFLNDNFDLPNIDVESITRNFLDHEGKIVSVSEHQRTIGLTDEDAVPEVKKSRVNLGDVWKLGDHRLMCGDSTDKATVDKLMDGEKADMVFTDPPYGVNYEGGHFHSGDVNIKRKREKLASDSDDDIYADAIPLLAQFVDGPCYTWFSDSKPLKIYTAILAIGDLHAQIIWHKTNATYAAMGQQYKQRHEPCLYWKPKGSTLRWDGPSNECTLWELKKDGKNDYHPTQKPVELAERAINNHKAASVLDLFGGSGSTLIACEKTKRKCYMMELDPHYCTVILDRWEAFTGRKAERVVAPKLLKRPSSDKRRTISAT